MSIKYFAKAYHDPHTAQTARRIFASATFSFLAALSGCGALDGFAGFGYAAPAGSINFAQAPRAPGSADPFLNSTGSGNSQNPIFFPGAGGTFNNPTINPPTNEPTDSSSASSNTGPGGNATGGGG